MKLLHVFFSHFIINNTFNNNFNQTPFNCFLFNNNFNCSFNQTHILTQLIITKIDFLKPIFFQTTITKSCHNTKHTLYLQSHHNLGPCWLLCLHEMASIFQ